MAAAALALTGACRVDVSVALDTRADGGGHLRVTAAFDREATEALGELEAQLHLDDLEDAGWEVEGPVVDEAGAATVTATHAFESPEEAGRLIGDLAGEEPFRDFELEHERSFLRTRTSLRGTVDLARGLAAFSDDDLTAALGGLPLGVTEEELERTLGVPLAQVFGLQLAVDLPGRMTSNAPTTAGSAAVWAPRLGEQVAVEATASGWDLGTAVPLAVALVAAAGLAVWAVRRRPVRR